MADRLLKYALGALHAFLILFLVVAIAVASRTNAFSGVGTAPGLALGAWIATLSWAATAWALRHQRLARENVREILGRAGIAGFCAGAAFLPGVLVGVTVATRTFEAGSLVFFAVAIPFAGAAGSLVAILLALVDVGVFLVVERALRASALAS